MTLRLVDPKSAVETCGAKYSRHVPLRPGMLEWPDWSPEFNIADLDDMREGRSSLRLVLAERDGLHLRFVDIDRALAARTYAAPIDVVLEVVDGFCPWNAGRWRLVGDEKGATCERTGSAADITVDVRELGSIYLGGVTLRSLAAAGQVVEHTTGAVRAASKAFASDVRPWLSMGI